MKTLLYRATIVWTAVGLASGLFYREFTKMHDVPGGTQLAVVHTHTLTLGTICMLVLLALVGVYPQLEQRRSFRNAFWTWQAGLAITATMMTVKGCLQVLDNPSATSPAIAGLSGLGHMTITAAFIMLMVALNVVHRPGSANPVGQEPGGANEDEAPAQAL